MDARNRLKSMSEILDSLIEKRNAKANELVSLKSKGNDVVSFKNPNYEGFEDEESLLLPISEEDADRARELEAEIKKFDDAIADQDAKMRNSLQRLRRSVENFIKSDDTLGNRIRELFRREGVTVASILTAIAMTISTIVEGIVLATRSVTSTKPKPPTPKPDPPPPEPPKPKPDPPPPEPPKLNSWTDWIKNQLKKIADLLLKLGEKALIALPGIIGSAINFVLKSAGSVAGYLAEHLWVFALAVGGIIYTYVTNLYGKRKKS